VAAERPPEYAAAGHPLQAGRSRVTERLMDALERGPGEANVVQGRPNQYDWRRPSAARGGRLGRANKRETEGPGTQKTRQFRGTVNLFWRPREGKDAIRNGWTGTPARRSAAIRFAATSIPIGELTCRRSQE